MRASPLFCVYMMLMMSFFLLHCSAGSSDCKTPSFDRRRCYQAYTGPPYLTWHGASAACLATGQRLASLENEDLVKFVYDNFEFQWAWIGLTRTSDEQSDIWTSGHRLDRTQYRSVQVLALTSELCWEAFGWDSKVYSISNYPCDGFDERICETFGSNIFKVNLVGDVVYDVSSGQAVESDVDISVIDCVRECRYDWTCQAISHDGVTCKLHFNQTGHNITVSSSAAVYARMI